jgi:hypothetical protein
MSFLLVHRRIAALLGALSAPLVAQTVPDASVSLESPAVPISTPAGSLRAELLPAWRRDSLSPSAGPSLSTLGVVELPPENGMANGRRHHAVSIPFDAARQTARRLGIDATQCAVQLRMPTHLARDPVAGGRSTVDVQAQVRLACRME